MNTLTKNSIFVSQTKKHSIIEQICNIGSGFIISVLIWGFVVTPYLGIEYKFDQAVSITIIFTVVSIIRGYLWRRLFNWITVNGLKNYGYNRKKATH